MACNCNNSNVFRSLVGNIANNTAGTAVVLTPDNTLSPVNESKVSFIPTVAVPVAGMSLPAYIQLNGATVPIYDRFGNIVYGANIRTRYAYRGYYGTNGVGGTAHLQLTNYPIGRQCNC